MKRRYRLFRRRKSIFYVFDNATCLFKSLRTRDRAEAEKLVQAYNDTVNQSIFNLSLARIYMSGADPKFLTRTWQDVMEYMVKRRGGENRRRWSVAIKDKNLDCIRNREGDAEGGGSERLFDARLPCVLIWRSPRVSI